MDDIQQLKNVRNVLVTALDDLELSIVEAYESLKIKYGEEHFCIKRLHSYFPAIDLQRQYIQELDKLIVKCDYNNYSIVSAICAISEFIKNDAKSLLNVLQTQQESYPDDVTFH
jgi:hypothetical protein